MTTSDVRAETNGQIAVTTDGMARVSGRRPIDLQRSAGRLLKTSVEKFYDAEVDIDWDSPYAADAHYFTFFQYAQ